MLIGQFGINHQIYRPRDPSTWSSMPQRMQYSKDIYNLDTP